MERREFIARLGGAEASSFGGTRATISWITILIVLFALAVGWKEANIDGRRPEVSTGFACIQTWAE
jgi:hypothetical protein